MMEAAINSVDDGIGLAGQLVVQTALDQLAENGRSGRILDGEVGLRASMATCGAVHGLDDVAPYREIAQRLFHTGLQLPYGWREPLGQSEPLQCLGASNHPAL